jgi:hypothetical protein
MSSTNTSGGTVHDVLEDLHLSEYYDKMVEHGFDTRAAFQLLADSDLDSMAITKLGHRKLLLQAANSDKM